MQPTYSGRLVEVIEKGLSVRSKVRHQSVRPSAKTHAAGREVAGSEALNERLDLIMRQGRKGSRMRNLEIARSKQLQSGADKRESEQRKLDSLQVQFASIRQQYASQFGHNGVRKDSLITDSSVLHLPPGDNVENSATPYNESSSRDDTKLRMPMLPQGRVQPAQFQLQFTSESHVRVPTKSSGSGSQDESAIRKQASTLEPGTPLKLPAINPPSLMQMNTRPFDASGQSSPAKPLNYRYGLRKKARKAAAEEAGLASTTPQSRGGETNQSIQQVSSAMNIADSHTPVSSNLNFTTFRKRQKVFNKDSSTNKISLKSLSPKHALEAEWRRQQEQQASMHQEKGVRDLWDMQARHHITLHSGMDDPPKRGAGNIQTSLLEHPQVDLKTLIPNLQSSVLQGKTLRRLASRSQNLLQPDLSAAKKIVMSQFIELAHKQSLDKQQRLQKVGRLISQRKALALLRKIEKGPERPSSDEHEFDKEELEPSSSPKKLSQALTIQERFKQAEEATHDSDLAEQDFFKQIEKKQKIPSVQPSSRNLTPQLDATSPSPKPMPGAMESTLSFSPAQKKKLADRKAAIDERVNAKADFKEEMNDILQSQLLVQEMSRLDENTNDFVREPNISSMSRRQVDEIFKQEFEMKTSMMNEKVEEVIQEVYEQLDRAAEANRPDDLKLRLELLGKKRTASKQQVIPEKEQSESVRTLSRASGRSQKDRRISPIKMIGPHRKKKLREQLGSSESTREEKEEKIQIQNMTREERLAYLTKNFFDIFNQDPSQIQRQERIDEFLAKLNEDGELPQQAIKNMILLRMKQFEKHNVNAEKTMAKQLTQDELVKGLCLLLCLKSDEVAAGDGMRKGKDPARLQSRILGKAHLMKTYEAGGLGNAEGEPAFNNPHRQINVQRQSPEEGEQAHDSFTESASGRPSETQSTFSEQGRGTAKGQRQPWFSSDVYKAVIGQLLDEQKQAENLASKHSKLKLDKEEQSVQVFARNISLRNEFNVVCKYSHKPMVSDSFSQNPMLQYFQNCSKENVLNLPILNRVTNKVLPLLGYKLNMGVCSSLREALQLNRHLLHTIVLDETGLSDAQFAVILEGLQSQETIRAIVSRQNEFAERSFRALQPLLCRKKPKHLQELRLVRCNISQVIVHDLLAELVERNTAVSKLSLVKAHFNDGSFRRLIEFMRQNRQLRELDISHNALRQRHMLDLANVLAKDRKLVNLNLSWNFLWEVGASGTQEKKEPTKEKAPVEAPKDDDEGAEEEGGKTEKLEEQEKGITLRELMEYEREMERQKTKDRMTKGIVGFIKYNHHLQHLDLTNTGLDAEILREVADQGLCKARSLVSLHLSQNPGITDEILAFYWQRLKAHEQPDLQPINFGEREQHRARAEHDNENEARKEKMQEFLKLKQIKNNIRLLSNAHKIDDQEAQILQVVRVLGHKPEMPGKARWKVLDKSARRSSCWICEQEIYSLIFWSKSVGELQSENVSEAAKRSIVKQILDQTPSLDPVSVLRPEGKVEPRVARLLQMYEEDKQRPLVCGDFTDWKPVRMLRVDELAQALSRGDNTEQLDFFDDLREQQLIRHEPATKVLSELKADDQAVYLQHKRVQMKRFNENWANHLKEELKYKKPFVCNATFLPSIDPANEQLYVLPCFARPGRQSYVVVQADDLASNPSEQTQLPTSPANYFIHREIFENRDEEVAAFSKKMKNIQKERVFDHANSVFREWKPDSAIMLEKCLEHDFKYWKGVRFCKDPDELELVKKVVKQNFVFLKKVFHFLSSKSLFPGLGWQDFTNWTIQIQIPDDKVQLSSVDRTFVAAKAANVELEEKIETTTNSDNSLCRFQFLEIVVRLGKCKYMETGIEKTFSKAAERVIKQNMKKFDETEEWQGFRDDVLWKIPVHDLLEPNIPGLRKVYESFFEPRKRYMNMKDCVDLFTNNTDLLPLDKDVQYCFGMSKMTYATETKNADAFYGNLKFVEFLEMLGRVAKCKYAPSAQNPEYAEMPFVTKLEYVLDEVLATQNIKRKDPEVVEVDESESDEDY